MSRLFGKGTEANGGDFAPVKHREYRYLITDGWTQQWVHCPVCRSRNNGKTVGGIPIYRGGTINVHCEQDLRTGSRGQQEVSCLCTDGVIYRGIQKVRPITLHDDPVKDPAIVLWDVVKMKRRPRPEELPPEPDPEIVREYTKRIAEQFFRFAKGEITGDEMRENETALRKRFMPPLVMPKQEDEN